MHEKDCNWERNGGIYGTKRRPQQLNTCFVNITTPRRMCEYERECVPLQVLGCGGADSIQHQVIPWPPDFGHFTSHDSFTQPQVLQAGFCHAIQNNQVIRPVPVLHAVTCSVSDCCSC